MEKKWIYERFTPVTVYGYQVTTVHEEDTGFQHLQIVENDHFGRMMVLDNAVQTTEKEEFIYHEMMTHVPIQAHKGPVERILIVGGGDGGILQECLRYDSVKKVTMVDIDGRVIEVSKEMLFFSEAFKDPRLELIVGDGAAYVASPEAQTGQYDIVIVDSPDPVGPARVLFETPFYKNIAACLKDNGIMVRHAGVPVFQAPVLKEAVTHISLSFPNVQVYRGVVPVYGGDMAFVIASKSGEPMDRPQGEYTGKYYHPRFHAAAFVLPTFWYELSGLSMD